MILNRVRSVLNTPLRRRGALAVALATAAAAVYVLFFRGHASDAAFSAFVEAVEKKDAHAIYAMTVDEEKRHYGVTEKMIANALKQSLYTHAPAIRYARSSLDREYGEHADGWYTRVASWKDAQTGRVLPAQNFTGVLQTPIAMFRAPNGEWKVGFTRFLAAYVNINYTLPVLTRIDVGERDKEQAIARKREMLASLGVAKLYTPRMTKVRGRWVLLQTTKGG